MIGRWILPAGWAWARAEEIAEIVGGGTPSSTDPSNFTNSGIPWVTPSDLTGYDNPYIAKGKRDLTQRGYTGSGAQLVPSGAVLFSSRAPIGYCAIAATDLATSQGFKTLVCHEGVLPEFVRYYLLSSKEYAESLASGTTFLELSATRMKELYIPVAPLDEQQSVVDKLNNQFEQMRKARRELACIPELVDKYRTQLLQAAYDGTLLGSSDTLVPLSTISSSLNYGTARKSRPDSNGVPVLRIPNISEGEIDLSDLKHTDLDPVELEKLKLELGDILVVRSNGSPDLVGRPAVVGPSAVGMAYAGYLIRIRLKMDQIVPQYLAYMLQAPQLRRQIQAGARSTSGVHNVNAKQLAALAIPLPSVVVQVELVKLIEAAFGVLHRVEVEVATAFQKVDDLTKAVLGKAFRGKEGGEKSNSEVGNDLLARIRQVPNKRLPTLKLNMGNVQRMAEDPAERLVQDSTAWPAKGLPFEEIARRVVIERDQMRDAVFALLAGETPTLVQVFDPSAGCILIRRVKP